MLKKDLVCILCPNGCQLEVLVQESPEIKVLEIKGCACEKGFEWAQQEIINPVRSIASSIVVDKGDFPLVSVRTDVPIPLGKIFDVMDVIKQKRVTAPVKIGEKLIENPARVECNIVATKNVYSDF